MDLFPTRLEDLGGAANPDAASLPGIRAGEIVDHDRDLRVRLDIGEATGAGEVEPAEVDRAGVWVVAEPGRDHARGTVDRRWRSDRASASQTISDGVNVVRAMSASPGCDDARLSGLASC